MKVRRIKIINQVGLLSGGSATVTIIQQPYGADYSIKLDEEYAGRSGLSYFADILGCNDNDYIRVSNDGRKYTPIRSLFR